VCGGQLFVDQALKRVAPVFEAIGGLCIEIYARPATQRSK